MYLFDLIVHVRQQDMSRLAQAGLDPAAWLIQRIFKGLGDAFADLSLDSRQMIGCSLQLSVKYDDHPMHLATTSLEAIVRMIYDTLEGLPDGVMIDHVGVSFLARL